MCVYQFRHLGGSKPIILRKIPRIVKATYY
jgi:hypothetical protein